MKYWILGLFLILISCRQKNMKMNDGNVFDIERNLSYGNSESQKLDLYQPQNKNSNNIVFIMVHGGGWSGGDKQDFRSFMYNLMGKFPQNIFVNTNYQLAGNAYFALPTQPNNIIQVMKFVDDFTKNKNQYILVGASAGAHISMMTAYHFDQNRQVKAVANLVGPTQLDDRGFSKYPDFKFIERNLLDPSLIPKDGKSIHFGSPVTWINTAVPTISFYGDQDEVVPISQKTVLDSSFKKTEIKNESHIFPGSHTDFQNDENMDGITEKIKKFINQL